jgi:hypothetical protein
MHSIKFLSLFRSSPLSKTEENEKIDVNYTTNRAKFKSTLCIFEAHRIEDGNKLVFERFACKLLFSLSLSRRLIFLEPRRTINRNSSVCSNKMELCGNTDRPVSGQEQFGPLHFRLDRQQRFDFVLASPCTNYNLISAW